MKIVQLVFTLGSGGGEKFVVNLSNQLAEMGHDVTLVQLRNDMDYYDIHFNRKFLSDKVKYINLGLTKGFKLAKAFSVMKALKKLNPDIVHSHLNVLPYYYPITILPGKPKFVHTIHNVADKETSIKWQQIINRWVYKLGFIKPVTISEECKRTFEQLYHLKSPICIDNGCPEVRPTDSFDDVKSEIIGFKHSIDSKVFVHIGRCNEQKNQELLIRAFNNMVGHGLDAELIVIGLGFNTELGKRLQNLACDRIHFLGERSNVGDYLLNSDYFILSSLWEGLPISLIEAMSAKVIPISTPAGGISNVIIDGITGFLSPDFTFEGLKDTIERALSNPLNHDGVYASFVNNYSMEQCAYKYVQVYNSIL